MSASAMDAAGRVLEGVDFVWVIADHRAGSITQWGRFRAGPLPGVFGNAVSVTGVQTTTAGVNYAYADLTGIGDGLDTSDLGVLHVGVTGGSPIPALGGRGWLLAALLAAVGA